MALMGISDSTAGAGANANTNSKVNMMSFLGSDTLAELVWSPRTGLNIKFAEKKPTLLWEVGPSGTTHGHTDQQNQEATNHDPSSKRVLEDGMTSGVDGPGPNSGPPLKIEPVIQCEPEEHHESNNLEIDDEKKEKDGCFSDPFCKNGQDSNSKNEKMAERCESLKEKTSYCQENAEKHEDESYGSMESCKSANNVLTKRKSSFDQHSVLESKRIKKQTDECMAKKDSTFMNWISNMLKGLKNHENYNPRINVCEETRSFQSQKMGFQNVFQSLYTQDPKAHETIKQIENKSVCSLKETVITNKCSLKSLDCLEIKEKEADNLVKHISLYERVTKEAPKGIFDTIRKLRLSRTDILKLLNSRSTVANLDGFFLRLRVAKWEEGTGGSRYYVACITGLQGETPWKGLKQPIRVNVGGVDCFVESQHISNCDFLEDELVAWWQKTSKNGVKDLKLKLVERRTLGL